MRFVPSVSRAVSKYSVPFLHLNAPAEHLVSCKRSDLYRCAVTVGNPSFISLKAIRQYGFWPVLCTSVLEKCLLVASNIEVRGTRMRLRNIYNTHISDTKRIVSYSLGMAFAKFHSERLLRIRNLMHLEFLKQHNVVTFAPQLAGKRSKEPDLLGQDANQSWHLFEAKGTSYEDKLSVKLTEGKVQTAQILTICGQLPTTRSVSATYIGRDRIYTRIEDPSDRGAETIDFDERQFMRAYYAPFLISEQKEYPNSRDVIIDGIPTRMFSMSDSRGEVSIGVLQSIYPLLRSGGFDALHNTLNGAEDLTGRESDQYSFGLDGFVVGFRPSS